jgi:hypothetical protein
VVATAEAAADWKRYLTAYPWVTLGAGFAVGYLIVPRRKPKVTGEVLADLTKLRETLESTRQAVAEPALGVGEPRRKRGLFGAAVGLVAPVALRAVQGYALKYLEHWMTQQQFMHHAHAGPPPAAPGFGTSTGPRPGGQSGPAYGPPPGGPRPAEPRRPTGPEPL